ncbi:insulinase family protein [Mariprofundus sp. NF]|uniref:M16 family metallopeptidase n=1 Tax=Mariprofundus sp. NF TaxID=2608716 RepID=UPI0015A078F7|nr:pitrilysin family protein [Mariprofundus sp. NF]NWF38903.1 insulinase family protein [Mariprofundus sp. NF]
MRYRLITALLLLLSFSSTASAVPPIQQAQLNNGLRILLMEAHNVPMVSMNLAMVAGSRFDTADKGGTASILASMLSDHTAKHGHEVWADLLDGDAIQLGGGVGRDEMNLSLTVLKDVLEPGLDAFAEALLQPGWNKKRFAIMKQNALASAQKEQEEPGVQAGEAAATLLFAGHPYGHRSGGSLASLKKIEIADLKQLYKTQIKPQGAVLAVSGDITMAELKPLLEKKLATWIGSPANGLADITAPQGVRGKNVDVSLPTSQTQLQLLRLGPTRGDADFFPVFVLNHILGGGGFGSRLMEEVREKRGLTYGVYSYFSPLATNGPFVISLRTRADQATEAEAVVRNVLAEMAAGKITKKQLTESKENLTGSFAQRMDSNRERVSLISMIGLYNLPLDYLTVWSDRIDAVTLQQLRDQAAVYLNPDHWNRVRVGSNLK